MLSLRDSFAVLCLAGAVSGLGTGVIRFVATPSYPEGGQDAVLGGVLGTVVGTGQPEDMS